MNTFLAGFGAPTNTTINGTTLTFSFSIRLHEGVNSLSLTATNLANLTTSQVLNLTYQPILPQISQISPYDGMAVSAPQITIQGVVNDVDALVEIIGVNSAADTSINNGKLNFRIPVTLQSGLNTLVISATGKYDAKNTSTLHITYIPTTVAISQPVEGETISDDQVTVIGTFQGSFNTGIKVNGVLASVVGDTFYALVPLQLGSNALVLTAKSFEGTVITQTLNIVSTGPAPIQVIADVISGIAPLSVTFKVVNNSPQIIAMVEADFDGDKTIDVTKTDLLEPLNFTYTTPGVYPATFKITDSAGIVTEKVIIIVVQSGAQTQQVLQSHWSGMNTALIAGDIPTALSYLTPQAQTKFGPVFATLIEEMPAIIAAESAPLPIMQDGDSAEYAIKRTIDGVDMVFLIYYLRDIDGVWHVDAM